MAARQPLRRSARHRAPVDAVVRVETTVFVGDQHREVTRIDLAAGRRKTPAPVGQRERAQEPSAAINDDRRADAGGGEVERPEVLEIEVPRRRQPKPQQERERAEKCEYAAFEGVRPPFPRKGGGGHPRAHFAVTSIEPKPVRPKRSGRYMSSAVAGG